MRQVIKLAVSYSPDKRRKREIESQHSDNYVDLGEHIERTMKKKMRKKSDFFARAHVRITRDEYVIIVKNE